MQKFDFLHMLKFLGIFFSIFLIFSISNAFAEVVDFTTNKSLYHSGDEILISGSVSNYSENPFIIIQIITPDQSDIVGIDQISVSSDGDFVSSSLSAGGSKWSSDGFYMVKIIHNGFLEKSIEYQELSEYTSTQEPESSTPEPESSTPEPESSTPEPELKLQIPNFPALGKPPQYYIDRYNNEQSYKSWFDSQFPNNSIHDVVGYELTNVDNFPALDKSPQYYIDRYNNEQSYKSWFDSQFPNSSIYNILGYDDPVSVPSWVRNNAEWWATGQINDSAFVQGIEFMLENNIIMVSTIPSGNISNEEIPDWIRNNAHWWSQDLISEDEFVNSLEFLIQEGIITVN
jgi:hypothetical protein